MSLEDSGDETTFAVTVSVCCRNQLFTAIANFKMKQLTNPHLALTIKWICRHKVDKVRKLTERVVTISTLEPLPKVEVYTT